MRDDATFTASSARAARAGNAPRARPRALRREGSEGSEALGLERGRAAAGRRGPDRGGPPHTTRPSHRGPGERRTPPRPARRARSRSRATRTLKACARARRLPRLAEALTSGTPASGTPPRRHRSAIESEIGISSRRQGDGGGGSRGGSGQPATTGKSGRAPPRTSQRSSRASRRLDWNPSQPMGDRRRPAALPHPPNARHDSAPRLLPCGDTGPDPGHQTSQDRSHGSKRARPSPPAATERPGRGTPGLLAPTHSGPARGRGGRHALPPGPSAQERPSCGHRGAQASAPLTPLPRGPAGRLRDRHRRAPHATCSHESAV